MLIKGFYDGIAPLSTEERALLRSVPDDPDALLKLFGLAGCPSRMFVVGVLIVVEGDRLHRDRRRSSRRALFSAVKTIAALLTLE